MAIFLRHSWNVKPPRWGSPADVQYAIRKNAEKIYQVDPDSIVLAMPLFWGLPPMDYSGKNNHGTNYGATCKDGSLYFDGSNDYVNVPHHSSIDFADEDFTIALWMKTKIAANNSRFFCKGGAIRYEAYGNIDNTLLQFVVDDDIVKSGGGYTVTNVTSALQHYNFIRHTDTNLLEVFQNGVSVGTQTDNTGSISNNEYLGIGGHGTGYSNGLIDEVHISNVARTADQIALFHDLPWALYQPVSRPIWLIPAATTTSPPTTVAPTTSYPTTIAPTTVPVATTSPPTTSAPTTLAPTTLAPPTTVVPTTAAIATTPPPTTIVPTTLPPTTAAPTSLAPTTLEPTLPPTTLAPTTVAPTTVVPTTIAPTAPPTTSAPTTVAPTEAPTLPPTTIAPTTPSPTTLSPTTLAPTTTVPTSLPPTTLEPTTLPPTTLAPTAPPTTLQSTTLGPTTIAPTTLPPTTLVPTTDIPETICIKTCDSLITSEIICYAPITEEILCYGNLC